MQIIEKLLTTVLSEQLINTVLIDVRHEIRPRKRKTGCLHVRNYFKIAKASDD